MEKAKAAVNNFISKDGKHETTVHESVNPAVQNEHVNRTHHEKAQQVVDREVHQDHHHTSVQPIHDKEVLPEKHTHNMGAVQHKEIQHGNKDHTQSRLDAEKAQFKDTREVGETQHSHSHMGTVTGEHVHHHVHENIQPVIHKETVQPSVTHTTIPVHEVHQNEAKHHNATQLPAVSMEDFKSQGGKLSGYEDRKDKFHGEPKNLGGLDGRHTIGGHGASGTTTLTRDGEHNGNHAGGMHNTSSGTTGVPSTSHHSGTHDGHSHNETTTKKPSLLQKLNPLSDADGDGKKGFMD